MKIILNYLQKQKKLLLKTIIDGLQDEDYISVLIEELTVTLKPLIFKTDRCGQCGNDNIYCEYELGDLM